MNNTAVETTREANGKNCRVADRSSKILDIQLAKSIEFERTKRDRDELLKKLEAAETKLKIQSSHLANLLSQVENRFDLEKDFYCIEDANEYFDAAMFAEMYSGRKNNRTVHVKEWIDQQEI
jgi:hypothetical protein